MHEPRARSGHARVPPSFVDRPGTRPPTQRTTNTGAVQPCRFGTEQTTYSHLHRITLAVKEFHGITP